MEQGYLLDEGYGRQRPGKWIEGAPELGMWTGLRLRGKRQLEITTYRCRRCGYLESYADED
jgi:hypothetical protein